MRRAAESARGGNRMSQQPETALKKGKTGIVLVLAIVVLAAGGAGGAVFWRTHRSGHPAAEAKPVERGIVSFDPFVVNLADPDASRFLRATIQLVVPSGEAAETIQKAPLRLMEARSAILELLTVQTSNVLVTPAGKATLKKAIAERVAAVLGETKVLDVLFSDFVIQF